jgi:hypothetical protein
MSPRQIPVQPRRGRRAYLLATVALAACELAGMAALVQSYRVGATTVGNTSEFVLFWAGMFLLELPIAGLIARRATPQSMRTALLILFGLVSYAPKLLRNPSSPVYHDEFAHWRATYDLLSTGKLFQPVPLIPIISRYPGLHAATAALVHATGLTIWHAALLLLILLHVALVLGVATLAQSLGLNNRTASIVAILYGLNSSFLYFDTEYAYESMAITLLVWALVAYVQAVRSQSWRNRGAWGVLTVMLSAGTIVTHHLSTFTLVMIMMLLAVAMTVPWLARGEDGSRGAMTAWCLALVTALMAGAWFHFVAPGTFSYLSPYVGQGLSQLLQAFNGSGQARQLFGASLSPWWEQKSAYLVPVFAVVLAAGGLLLIRAGVRSGRLPRGRRRALLLAFAFLGLVYFPSTIFILVPASAEGARRSWAFTWIGLCLLAGPAVVWLLGWIGRHKHQRTRVSLRLGLFAALAIALIGGVAAGQDPVSRFPGPFLFGSDGRIVTPELLATSQWFSAHFGTGNNIVTDRDTGLIFGSYGLQNPVAPSAGFPAYDLDLAQPGKLLTPAGLQYELSGSQDNYLIVDGRMAYEFPENGVFFVKPEPSFKTSSGKPIFYSTLGNFYLIPWMVKIYQSDAYSIYRLNLPVGTKIPLQQLPTAPAKPTKPGKSGKRGKSSKRGKSGKLGQPGKLLQGKLSVTP